MYLCRRSIQWLLIIHANNISPEIVSISRTTGFGTSLESSRDCYGTLYVTRVPACFCLDFRSKASDISSFDNQVWQNQLEMNISQWECSFLACRSQSSYRCQRASGPPARPPCDSLDMKGNAFSVTHTHTGGILESWGLRASVLPWASSVFSNGFSGCTSKKVINMRVDSQLFFFLDDITVFNSQVL